uniref:Uncharacterized protein n=1 Tax=Timema poppense TaxID=170557 RepID=A0A7R9HC78_TIMPO|nr:unnamed protein product [Timema poppensis]
MESSVSRRKIVPAHVLIAQEYAERTSIHGIRYIANSTGGLPERRMDQWTGHTGTLIKRSRLRIQADFSKIMFVCSPQNLLDCSVRDVRGVRRLVGQFCLEQVQSESHSDHRGDNPLPSIQGVLPCRHHLLSQQGEEEDCREDHSQVRDIVNQQGEEEDCREDHSQVRGIGSQQGEGEDCREDHSQVRDIVSQQGEEDHSQVRDIVSQQGEEDCREDHSQVRGIVSQQGEEDHSQVRDIVSQPLSVYLNLTAMNDTMRYYAWRVMSIVSILQFPFYGRAYEHLKAIPEILHLFTESFNITQFALDVRHHTVRTRYDITQFALDTLPRCDEIFYACNWCGQALNCCEVFHLQPSEAGFCYSFNSLTSITTKHCRVLEEPDGSLDATESWKDPCIMWRNMGTGAGTGLELFLMPTTEENRIGRGQRDPNGYRVSPVLSTLQRDMGVMLHHSLSFPESAKGQYVREWKEDAFTMMITPSVTRASIDLRSLDISERNCYFPDEGHLDIFHTYTQESCYIECRLKYIIDKCGCQPYFFRFGEGQVRPCLLSEFFCIAANAANLRTSSPPANTPGFRWEATLNCSECLPTCHETVYNMDTLTSKDPMGVNTPADCYLDIYYKDAGFVKYWTSISFGSQELLEKWSGSIIQRATELSPFLISCASPSGPHALLPCTPPIVSWLLSYNPQSWRVRVPRGPRLSPGCFYTGASRAGIQIVCGNRDVDLFEVSFGGIMGLFLGVSFLSVVELLVYLMKFLGAVFPFKTHRANRRAHVVHVRPAHLQSHRRARTEKRPTSGSLGFLFENEMRLGTIELY